MQRWLLDIDKDVTNPTYQLWTEKDLQCTPKGQVLLLEGEKSVFDLNTERAKQFETARKEFAKLPAEEARHVVRKVAGIRPLDQLPESTLRIVGRVTGRDYRILKLVMDVDGDVSIPILRLLPNKPNGKQILYLPVNGKENCLNESILEELRAGFEVWAVDLRGVGELRHSSGSKSLGDWKTFFLAYLLDQSLTGGQTNDVLNVGQVMQSDLKSSNPANANQKHRIHLVGGGVAAFHANAVDPDNFIIRKSDTVPGWANLCEDRSPDSELTSCIHSVLMQYDIDDLLPLLNLSNR
jgi:hypothetical protein